jgi:RHS repeat-associated protein
MTVSASGPASDQGSADIAVINTASAASVSLDVATVNPGGAITRAQCLTIAAGDAAYECGDLRLAHALPAATTFAKARAPTLVYNSRAAKGLGFVAANVRVDNGVPTSLSATLSVNGASIVQSFSNSSTCTWRFCRIVIPIDGAARNFVTGAYDYTLTVQAVGTNAPPVITNGVVVIVNRAKSPLGAGWWLAGLEQLANVPGHTNQKLWIGGDGDARVYTQVGSTSIWTVSPALDRADTLENVTANLWRRHGRNKVWVEFDSLGRHIATVSRTGQRTAFTWTGATLDRIALPVPAGSPARDYVLTYAVDGGGERTVLQSVTAPSDKGVVPTVSLGYVSTWWVSSITDPDQQIVSFGYDGTNNLVRRTNRRGHASWFAYDEGGGLKSDSVDLTPTDGGSAAPIVRHYCASETRSLTSCAVGAQSLAGTYTQLDGPRTDVTDITKFYVNRFGAPDSVVNALGGRTKIEYSTAFPLLSTAVVMPNGFRTEATYTSRGLLDSLKALSPRGDGVNAITTYSWDSVWDFPTSARTPTGQLTNSHYDAATGNIDWRQLGGDTTKFSYYADGLPLSVRQSNGAVDTVWYDAVFRNLLEYRASGGLVGTSISTKQTRDSLGRVVRVVTPASGADSLVEQIVYDAVGQDTLHTTAGGGLTLRVRQQFDAEGNLTLVGQLSTPDITGEILRTFGFDAANRPKSESVAGEEVVFYTYDPAGNLLVGGRRSPGATTTYDALNRAVKSIGYYTTDTLTYDVNGNVVTANNENARISRTYYPSGWLKTETQRIALSKIDSVNFDTHIYDLRYTYDIGARRDTLVLPPQLGGGRVTYTYDPRTGQLEAVTDRLGNRFRHHYDLMGRLDSLIRLDGRAGKSVETFEYDLRSRITRRRIVADSAVIGLDVSLAYDRRDKVVAASGDAMTYDGFGHVTDVDFNTNGTDGHYTLDALGNRSWSRDDRGHLNIAEIAYQYDPGTGRVSSEANSLPHPPDQGDTTWTSHDGIGNLYYSLREKVLSYMTILRWTVYNNYDGSNRMITHSMTYDTVANQHGTPAYNSSEYYRYDALARRVWYQAVRDTGCAIVNGTCFRNCNVFEPETACISPITRAVWDGEQILYEMRADGGPFAGPTAKENDATTGALYGRVEYTHGLAIDTPLGIIKSGSQIIPWTNWRGQIDQATCPIQACSSSQVKFPQRGVYGASGYVSQPPPNWYGSLIEGQRDGSGYIYQRNRYLDPSTGRFTQEDPIGLAGGSNLYGYANGDPVTYSDPFGLSPKIVTEPDDSCHSLAGCWLSGAWTTVKNFWAGSECSLQLSCDTPPGVDPKSNAYSWGRGVGLAVFALNHPYEGVGPEVKPTSVNQMNTQVRRGQAPKSVKRVDVGKVKGEQDNVHFQDGSTLNRDGTWKHGQRRLTRQELDWLQRGGFTPPST